MIIAKDFVLLDMHKTGTGFRLWFANQYNGRYLYGDSLWHSIVALRTKKARTEQRFRYLWVSFVSRLMRVCARLGLRRGYPEPMSVHWTPDGRKEGKSWEHGGASDIPAESMDKEIVTVLRNPYRQMRSKYQYAAQHYEQYNMPFERAGNFTEFIKQTAEQWVPWWSNLHFGIKRINYPLGMMSYTFIRMYFKDPVKILSMSAEEFEAYCAGERYKEDIYPIKFFRLEVMNQQLCEYLRNKPYLDERIVDEIFEEAAPKNLSKKQADAVWDDEKKAYFEKAEGFYIRMVKELAPLPQDDF